MPFLTSRLALAGALLAPVFAQPLNAQTATASTSEDILVVGRHARETLTTPYTTGSCLGLTPLETPATLSVIDGATIRARGDMSVLDAESRALGISNAGNPGNGGTALAARGFSGQGSALQLIEGVRLFPAAGTITFPTDPWMVERIDILSGPASVLYGQGALGGAVNVLMRKPNTTTGVPLGVRSPPQMGSDRADFASTGMGRTNLAVLAGGHRHFDQRDMAWMEKARAMTGGVPRISKGARAPRRPCNWKGALAAPARSSPTTLSRCPFPLPVF